MNVTHKHPLSFFSRPSTIFCLVLVFAFFSWTASALQFFHFCTFHIFPFFWCFSFKVISFQQFAYRTTFCFSFCASVRFLLTCAAPCVRFSFFLLGVWFPWQGTFFNQLVTARNCTENTIVCPSTRLMSTCFYLI